MDDTRPFFIETSSERSTDDRSHARFRYGLRERRRRDSSDRCSSLRKQAAGPFRVRNQAEGGVSVAYRIAVPPSAVNRPREHGTQSSSTAFDDALAALLALVGERVDVHVFGASTPHLVATFGGRLRAGYSESGGDPAPNEAIYLRLETGEEGAGLSLDREVFGDAVRHEDGSITLKFGGVELMVARRG
jgi:hypothetical protein